MATNYPLIPVTTSELEQRVVDSVTLGTKRTTACAKVDRWGNATEVVVDPDAGFAGDDQFSFRLTDDEGATGEFTVDVTVERILTCATDADCSGGDLCGQGTCVAPSELTAKSGGCGCTSGGAGALALWSLVALAIPLRRRRRTAPQAGRRP